MTMHSNETNPLVSICISAYDVEKVVRETMASVLAQTYQNFEVIVLDNGSTDATGDVLRSIADDRVQVLSVTPNLGAYQGMNYVVRHARGDLIAVYHSDDVYDPTIVEKEVGHFRSYPEVGVVFAMDHYMDENGHIFGGTSLPAIFQGRASLGYDELFRFVLRYNNIIFRCPTFMCRRVVFDTVGYFDPETFDIGSDVEMYLRIARRFPIAILPERLMCYRVTNRQWSARYKRRRTERDRHLQVMDHFLDFDGWRAKLSADDLNEYAFYNCDDETFRATNYVINGDPAAARELLRRGYSWPVFFNHPRRRKLRVMLVRLLLGLGLGLNAIRPLTNVLSIAEYGGHA